jgi:hypothetical protein
MVRDRRGRCQEGGQVQVKGAVPGDTRRAPDTGAVTRAGRRHGRAVPGAADSGDLAPLGDQSGEVRWRWREHRAVPAGQDRASRPDAGPRGSGAPREGPRPWRSRAAARHSGGTPRRRARRITFHTAPPAGELSLPPGVARSLGRVPSGGRSAGERIATRPFRYRSGP